MNWSCLQSILLFIFIKHFFKPILKQWGHALKGYWLWNVNLSLKSTVQLEMSPAAVTESLMWSHFDWCSAHISQKQTSATANLLLHLQDLLVCVCLVTSLIWLTVGLREHTHTHSKWTELAFDNSIPANCVSLHLSLAVIPAVIAFKES